MPKFYKSNPASVLPPDKDIIHDPDIRFFENEDEPSYMIENFIDEGEISALLNFFNQDMNL